jgi:hypothetical protein
MKEKERSLSYLLKKRGPPKEKKKRTRRESRLG